MWEVGCGGVDGRGGVCVGGGVWWCGADWGTKLMGGILGQTLPMFILILQWNIIDLYIVLVNTTFACVN